MKTAHRAASHAKRQYQGQLPKFWAPKLVPSQCLDAKIIHWDLIDRFTSGTADKGDLWDWIETGYTYCKLIELHQADGTEFTPEAIQAVSDQVNIFDSVIQRYKRTGRVAFNGEEMCIARAAAHVFDSLIDIDRHGIAVKAGQWAVQVMDRIRAMECEAMGRAA
jgi:hypothetical protein